MEPSPISEQTIEKFLSDAGLTTPRSPSAKVARIGGGVSNTVLGVRLEDRALIVKQALPRLMVADEWLAPVRRTVIEGRALELMRTITPGAVPPVVYLDEQSCVLVIEQADPGWRNWKTELMGGVVDPGIARRLGEILASWQSWPPERPSEFWDHEGFRALRLEPFHLTVASRIPALGDAMRRLAADLDAATTCLVHGDFSPKNVLAGEDGLWVIDAEVAHIGHPAFDPAYLLSHLVLKTVHRAIEPADAASLVSAFWTSYRAGVDPGLLSEIDLISHVGALLLSRAVGRSPAGYLNDAERDLTITIGKALVTTPPALLGDAVEFVGDSVRDHAN